jgi:hypothetical protein
MEDAFTFPRASTSTDVGQQNMQESEVCVREYGPDNIFEWLLNSNILTEPKLFLGSNMAQIPFTMKLLKLKTDSGWSNRSFSALLQ